MYSILLLLHGFFRWLVLASLLYSIFLAINGLKKRRPFTATANSWRHWTATIAHLQLLLGMALYFQSPAVRYALPADHRHLVNEHVFFRYIHITLMLVAVIVITIGSAKAKRAPDHRAKYRTMLVWFVAGLLILLIAIPWPFSPLAGRPLLRHF